MSSSTQVLEVARGERFEFGKNWARFLAVLDDERIAQAEKSLREMLGVEEFAGRTFLDIGSGSGLFSLAARRLGARVHSFDYDPRSVACTAELRRRYFPGDDGWTVEEGSALDAKYLARLGQFDFVYSWGVLHHTGQMWRALENAAGPVASGGKLFISIYNDMGPLSVRWRKIKRSYNRTPNFLKLPFTLAVITPGVVKSALRATVTLRLGEYVRSWTEYNRQRGMSRWHDMIDWLGGYPYECARPEEIVEFYRARGFKLYCLKPTEWNLGTNEFVFVKTEPSRHDAGRGTGTRPQVAD